MRPRTRACASAHPRPPSCATSSSDARRSCRASGDGLLEVSGLTGEQIGEIALAGADRDLELTPQQASLEEAFMSLTGESVEYRASAGEETGASESVRAAA